MLAAKIISQIEKTFGTRLSLAQIFRALTIEQLAVLLHESPSRAPSQAIAPRHDQGPAPLSHGEQQVWLHSQLAGDLPLYQVLYGEGPGLFVRALAAGQQSGVTQWNPL